MESSTQGSTVSGVGMNSVRNLERGLEPTIRGAPWRHQLREGRPEAWGGQGHKASEKLFLCIWAEELLLQ